MNQFRDESLHDAFLALGKVIINQLESNSDNQIKRFFIDLKFSTLHKIFVENFAVVKNSIEYKNLQKLLLENEKYAKNFSTPVGIPDWMFNLQVEQLLENFFMRYVEENGFVYQTDTLDRHYHNLERFLLDDEISVTVDTPMLCFKSNSLLLKIENEILIRMRTDFERRVEPNHGTDVIKYAFSAFKVVLEFVEKKKYEIPSEEEKQNSVIRRSKIILQNLMMCFRLYRAGKIGFIDSEATFSTSTGSVTWQNPRCDLPKDWNLWDKHNYVFEEEDIPKIKNLRADISKALSNEKNIEIARAIDRFMISYEDERIEDRILDLIISLEALLQNEVDELRYKLSIRTAKFLGKTPEQRDDVYKTILAAYAVRSKTAHGQSASSVSINDQQITLDNLADRIEEITRNAIKMMINTVNNGITRKSVITNLDKNLFLE